MKRNREREIRSDRALRRQAYILKYMPESLIEFPFECIVAYWGILGSLPLVLGVVRPPSLEDSLPTPVYALFKMVFLVGSVLMGLGLARKIYFPILHRAMQLVAYCLISYAFVLFAVIHWQALVAGGVMIAVSSILFLRSWWIRTSTLISDDIAREANNG